MKRYLFYTILASFVIFSGCSQKDVEIDTQDETTAQETNTQQTAQQVVQQNQDDTVANQQKANDSESNLNRVDVIDDSITNEDGNNKITKPILFAFDRFNLTPQMLQTARENSSKIIALGDSVKVKLEGNCDEWGSDEYNYALGLKRAKTVKDILVAEGFDINKISMVSYGESNPVCTEHTKECWGQNRRVNYEISN
jgi:peptidoglycan-associated lipoprotein